MYLILLEEHTYPRRQLLDRILLLFHHVGQVEADRANVNPSLGKVHLRHVVVVRVVQQRLEREEGKVKRSSTYRIVGNIGGN